VPGGALGSLGQAMGVVEHWEGGVEHRRGSFGIEGSVLGRVEHWGRENWEGRALGRQSSGGELSRYNYRAVGRTTLGEV